MAANYLELLQQHENKVADKEIQESRSSDLLEMYKNYVPPAKKKEEVSRSGSYKTAIPKGALREVGKELRKMSPQSLRGTPFLQTEEHAEEQLNKILPTRDDFISRSLERAGKSFPYIATGGAASALPIAVAGGVTGEGLKELGAPEIVQDIGEAATQGLPTLGKKIIPRFFQKEAVEFGRRMHMTEAEIAPLIQSEKKQKLLTKLSPKRGRTKAALQRSKQALGNIFNKLRTRPEAQRLMTPEEANLFANDISEAAKELPSGLRDVIKNDAFDLAKEGFTGDRLINFWQDISHQIGEGHEKLGILKGAISKALDRFSPELGKDFRMTNDLYGKFKDISSRLKPSLTQDLLSAARGLRILFGMSTGNLPILVESLGESVGKRVAREMLINPRFQNLGKQMVNALNNNKISIAKKIADQFAKLVKPIDKDLSKELEESDFNRSPDRKPQ